MGTWPPEVDGPADGHLAWRKGSHVCRGPPAGAPVAPLSGSCSSAHPQSPGAASVSAALSSELNKSVRWPSSLRHSTGEGCPSALVTATPNPQGVLSLPNPWWVQLGDKKGYGAVLGSCCHMQRKSRSCHTEPLEALPGCYRRPQVERLRTLRLGTHLLLEFIELGGEVGHQLHGGAKFLLQDSDLILFTLTLAAHQGHGTHPWEPVQVLVLEQSAGVRTREATPLTRWLAGSVSWENQNRPGPPRQAGGSQRWASTATAGCPS